MIVYSHAAAQRAQEFLGEKNVGAIFNRDFPSRGRYYSPNENTDARS
jgi:hypothetical protein